jgi:two-component system OmpR family response regulator
VRILLLEDDAETAHAIERGLAAHGFEVALAGSVSAARDAVQLRRPDAAILDLMVPGGSGYDVMTLLRSADPHAPVLVLTARDGVDDRVAGLERGADDYLVKPFALSELIARLRAVLRRPRTRVAPLRSANLELDPLNRRAQVDGRLVNLSPTELALLQCLLENEGAAVTRSLLLETVWGYRFDPTTNVVDVHMSRLRQKLAGMGARVRIATHRGVGYALE